MRANEFLCEGLVATLYHVAQTKNVKSIQAKGILPMQTTNWVKAGNKNDMATALFSHSNIWPMLHDGLLNGTGN